MNKAKKVLAAILSIMSIVFTAGCKNNSVDPVADSVAEDIFQITFSSKFLKVAGQTPEGWMESIEEADTLQYVEMYEDAEQGTVILEIEDSQKEEWKEHYKIQFDNLCSDFTEINDTYCIEYSDDYTQVDIYYSQDFEIAEAVSYVMYSEIFCAFEQLLDGVGPDDWKVTVNIYNSDTGNLVATGDSDTGLSYSPEDWEASK